MTQLDTHRAIPIDRKDLQGRTLVSLSSLWQGITDIKRSHGVGPGEGDLSTKSSKGSRSLLKIVEREASKCFRGFSRMATIVQRTEKIISEE